MTAAPTALETATAEYFAEAAKIEEGGGKSGIERQHRNGRLTARERMALLADKGTRSMECGLFSAWRMYKEYGGAPAAGVVTSIAEIDGRLAMVIANDATVKAGAFFPMTCKKIIRAQAIAERARLPLVYLVDSAGVFLPLQEDVFPDTDDFGRIFRNNAVISAQGIPQIAAIMGNCVAGGGYLPVLCDTLLMTEGSGLYLDLGHHRFPREGRPRVHRAAAARVQRRADRASEGARAVRGGGAEASVGRRDQRVPRRARRAVRHGRVALVLRRRGQLR